MTPISYKDAAAFLSVPETRIRNAVSRGILTQEPNKRSNKAVYQEQLSLFKGKSQLSLSTLSLDELQQWETIQKRAGNTASISSSVDIPDINIIEQVAFNAAKLGARIGAKAALAKVQKALYASEDEEDEQDEHRLFQPASPEQNNLAISHDTETGDAKVDIGSGDIGQAIALIVLLLLMAAAVSHSSTIVYGGITPDELASSESIKEVLEQVEPFIPREQLQELLNDRAGLDRTIERLRLVLEEAA